MELKESIIDISKFINERKTDGWSDNKIDLVKKDLSNLIDKAEELLCNTQLSSAEIAYECGFNTIRNFNIAFKNHYSITPKEFRKSEDKRTIIIND